ncbi:LysE family translocator [Methylobacterium oryzisoli]|uniref:LysE family translocator n=1 Tax=Methylobacterium oryzisoli TaxID=3385502 RepID=UPI00389284DD
MSVETWLAFAAASAVLVMIPGPTILLVVSYALGRGWRTALPAVAGVALGDATAMTLSLLGLGAVLAASATLFTLLKWLGAAYLVWLGLRLWRAGGRLEAHPREGGPALRMAAHVWLVTALNPKSLTFFIAFLPQFLDPRSDLVSQMAVFEATFLAIASLNALAYAVLAGRARFLFGRADRVRLFNRLGGSLLIGAGIATARSAP